MIFTLREQVLNIKFLILHSLNQLSKTKERGHHSKRRKLNQNI